MEKETVEFYKSVLEMIAAESDCEKSERIYWASLSSMWGECVDILGRDEAFRIVMEA